MILTPKLHQGTELSDALLVRIKNVIKRAEKEIANELLQLQEDVIILIDTDPHMIDPNIGVGGYTDDKNHIQLSIDPSHKNLSDKELFATLVHELSHVKRAYGPGYGTTLFDYMIFEGLGVAFEEEVCKSNTYYPKYLRSLHDTKQLVKSFSYMFDYDDDQYDHMDFIIGNKEKGIPEFAVYSMGLFFVEQYLSRTNKHASEVLLAPSKIFKQSSTL